MKKLGVVLQEHGHSLVMLQLLPVGLLLKHGRLDEVLLRLVMDVCDGAVFESESISGSGWRTRIEPTKFSKSSSSMCFHH